MDLQAAILDVDVQNTGEWRDLGDFDARLRGAMVKVRSMRSRAYRKYRRSLLNAQTPGRGGLKTGDLVESEEKLNRRALAALAADWKDICIGDTPVEYSEEVARKMAADPKFDLFFDAIRWVSSSVGVPAHDDADPDDEEDPEDRLGN